MPESDIIKHWEQSIFDIITKDESSSEQLGLSFSSNSIDDLDRIVDKQLKKFRKKPGPFIVEEKTPHKIQL